MSRSLGKPPFHNQKNSAMCGAACAEMVLDQALGQDFDQQALFEFAVRHRLDSGWTVDPDGLAAVLNHHTPHGNYSVFSWPDEIGAEKDICRMICSGGPPPIVAVEDGTHWVVVYGFNSNVESPDDLNFKVSKFLAVDPEWTEFIPCSRVNLHQDFQFTPFALTSTCVVEKDWKDYVGVARSSRGYHKYIAVWAGTIGMLQTQAPFLSAHAAAELSIGALAETFHDELERWADRNGKVVALAPLLVQRLDLLDTFYYIVPHGTEPSTAGFAVAIDARSGLHLQSAVLHEKSISAMPALSAEQAWERISGKYLQLPDKQGYLFVRPETVTRQKVLGWIPCPESRSQFLPFYLFSVGSHTIYVRTDGAIFTRASGDSGPLLALSPVNEAT